jgi:hypothetical protein
VTTTVQAPRALPSAPELDSLLGESAYEVNHRSAESFGERIDRNVHGLASSS